MTTQPWVPNRALRPLWYLRVLRAQDWTPTNLASRAGSATVPSVALSQSPLPGPRPILSSVGESLEGKWTSWFPRCLWVRSSCPDTALPSWGARRWHLHFAGGKQAPGAYVPRKGGPGMARPGPWALRCSEGAEAVCSRALQKSQGQSLPQLWTSHIHSRGSR